MAFSRRSIVLLCFLLVAFTVLPVWRLAAAGGPIIDRAGGPRDMVEVVLYAGAAPAPGQAAELLLEAKPLVDVPDLVITWQVSEGAVLIGDAEEHMGAVTAGQTVTSKRQVRFDDEGIYKVVGAAVLDYSPDLQYGASGVVFYTVKPFLSRLSDKDPGDHSPMGTQLPAAVSSSPTRDTPNAVTDDPCFTVNGTITRTERSPQPGGYVDSTGVPVSNVYVEVREEDLVFDDSYADVLTNADGFFQASFCDDDGWLDDQLEIYVRVHAEIYDSDNLVAEIEDSSYVDENYKFDSGITSSEGGTITYNIALTPAQSAIFNIGDAILDAWRVWRDSGGQSGGDALFDGAGEVHWEPGYGSNISYYYSPWNEITIADDPSDPDVWDDSVIIHEWGHMADDFYSCDDNPGGKHNVGELAASVDLAWGEGYPDYWQSVVRSATGQPFSTRYIDINGTGTGGIDLNLETTQVSSLASVQYEVAVAGALWDLLDTVNDGQDTVSYSHALMQEVYTNSTFDGASDCNFDSYAKAWVKDGKPADGPTAAAIMQNTGYTLAPQNLAANSIKAGEAVSTLGPTNGIWWNQFTYVVDNSKSMAGARFDAVKTVLEKAVNDLGAAAEGSEFTLNSYDNTNFNKTDVFAGQFFANRLAPAINNFATSNLEDDVCKTFSLYHLNQALNEQQGGYAWLFTDGDTAQFPSVENLKQALNERAIRVSVALLGVCPGLVTGEAEAAKPQAYQEMLAAAEKEGAGSVLMTDREQVEMDGALQRTLGLAADSTPSGIVPYLLTAINSGGIFLFVNPAQTANAADILQAQISHSAGAGTWSDYVSDKATYRYDELATWEYNWIDAAALGTNQGTPDANNFKSITLPGPFPFYGSESFSSVRAYEDGYITLGSDFFGSQPVNSTLPNPAAPNNVLYPYWDDLDYHLICNLQSNVPQSCGPTGMIYSYLQSPWFAIEHSNYYASGQYGNYMNFQTQLNLESGEIRYLYDNLAGVGAPSATIGLENATGTSAVQVSYNDKNGASDHMGYKFIPAPPQPTKVYSTKVDAQMGSIAFLLTGYSGTFEDLVVKYPNGQQVNCNDTNNVLCLHLGLVQYVQANVNGRYGEWQAIVDAGSSGEGTFSFFSMAASPITANTITFHGLITGLNKGIVTDLGQKLDGNVLSGWFVQPDDKPFGQAFSFFDDGTHQDGLAGDGIFGSDPYTPPGAGTGYLRLMGDFEGNSFIRTDPVPFSFQPVSLESLGDGANFGGPTELMFKLTNLDSVQHDYFLNASVPPGWSIGGIFGTWTIGPGQSKMIKASVTMGPNPATLPSGTSGEVDLTAVEAEKGIMTASASAVVTRHRPPASIDIQNPIPFMRPGGDTAKLEIVVVDEQGVGVADGTEIKLSATLGTIDPAIAKPKGGYLIAEFSTGNSTGTAVIKAQTDGYVESTAALISDQMEIEIIIPPANSIILNVDNVVLKRGAKTVVKATVTDHYGTPVPAQLVRIGVSGDGQLGTVGKDLEVITGMTDGNGRLETSFTAGGITGNARIRAELLNSDSGEERVIDEDGREIFILGGVFLPMIVGH